MGEPVYQAKFPTWTIGGVVGLVLSGLILGLGQYWRIQLGEDLWILGNIVSGVTVTWTAFLGIGVGFSAWARTKTSFTVFDDRVELTSTVIRKGTRRIEASQIESVDGSQSLLGGDRYGTVIVKGSGGSSIELDSIKDVDEVVAQIRAIASAPSRKSPQSRPAASALREDTTVSPIEEDKDLDVAGQLERLAKLNQDGVLDKNEFLAAKKKLLGL